MEAKKYFLSILGLIELNFRQFWEVCVSVCCFHNALNFLIQLSYLHDNIHGGLKIIFKHAGVDRIEFQAIFRGVC